MSTGPQTLTRIGPVKVNVQNASFSWGSAGPNMGRPGSIGGIMAWRAVQTCSLMFANPLRRISLAGASGVPTYLWFEGVLVGPWKGWYLVDDFSVPVEHQWTLNGIDSPTAFNMRATLIGHQRRPVVPFSSRLIENGVGVTGVPVAYPPFLTDTGDAEFLSEVGTTMGTREYDPASPLDYGGRSEPLS